MMCRFTIIITMLLFITTVITIRMFFFSLVVGWFPPP